jgi:putative hydrolase of the HAD superfamily
MSMVKTRAVLFDLHGTLAYVENPVSDVEISDYLFSRGYEVSPQQLRAAWFFVSMIDYPRYGYRSWRSYFTRIFWRLKVKVDRETLDTLVGLLESRPYQLYADAADAAIKAKENGFKTAIVTTIAYFQFEKAIRPIERYLDFVMTGYQVKCDKSNPKMYRRTLKILGVKPEEAVMIGDSVFIDVVLPKKIGMKAILLNRTNEDIKCEHADAVVNDLNQAVAKVFDL